jgi:acyl carrier protein
MKNNILNQLNQIFCEYFDDLTIILNNRTNANDIEEWDSLAQVGLILIIEKRFTIRFTSSEIENLPDIGAMVDLINEKQ